MSAQTRRDDAAHFPVARHSRSEDLWDAAVRIRQEWLRHGLSTQPADKQSAEGSLTAIYARVSRPRPRFEWVDSPAKALPLLGGLPTLEDLYRYVRDPWRTGTPPLASDLAMVLAQLRGKLGAGVTHTDPEQSQARQKDKKPWPELPPREALARGVPLGVLMHQGLRTALHRSLGHGFFLPVLAALDARPAPVCWYGQQDASWVGYYDALRRLGLASYPDEETTHLADWATLARSCGWWWPGEDVCVVAQRPETIEVEPVPGAWHEEVRARPGGVSYRDGWRPLG